MAKKKSHNSTDKKEKKNSDFDFSTLLSYCTEEEKKLFKERENNSPVSALLLNENILSSDELNKRYPDLRKEKSDALLYRFDKSEDQMGKTLEHFGGGFYILDPSSSAISYYLQNLLPKGFLSLDLCAAPGGKTIALNLRRRDGLFLANDIAYNRALEIDKNAQRMAFDNLLTLSIDPIKISLPDIFGLIILDVPCSGSGMIRKEKKMREDYSQEKVERLLPIQESLLKKAYELVKEGGIIAYSTCSLSTQEDEEQIQSFLLAHSDVEVIDVKPLEGMIKGKDSLGYHMIPGIYEGEGIYFILLRKKGEKKISLTEKKDLKNYPFSSLKQLKYKDNIYLLPDFYEEISNLPYLSLGIKTKDTSQHPKCEYDHSFSKVKSNLPCLSLTREEALSYIQGNELKAKEGKDGLVILCYEKMRLGLGKIQNGKIKNYLPKGLRGYLK